MLRYEHENWIFPAEAERRNKMADFSLDACYRSVVFSVEELKENPFELLGRYIIRADQDRWFNKTMIDAVKKYIEDNDLAWDKKFGK